MASAKPTVSLASYGAITAAGPDVASLLAAVRANASGLRANDRFNSPRFQSSIVGTAPRPSNSVTDDDPAFDLASDALTQARQNLTGPSPAPERTGLVLATTKANIEALERIMEGRACSERARRHLQPELLAEDLATEHGARGPRQTISNACTSGVTALRQGAALIRRGAADAVLVVGVDHLSAFVLAGFTALKALDPSGSRPFDRERSGLSLGEAGGAVVLLRDDLATAPGVELIGWGSSNDANHMTGPSRDGSGLALAIRGALRTANLTATDIDYINVHGTGTPYNDAMEAAALRTIFSEVCPPVSGQKGMLGHTLGAAGVVESIICALALREKFLPGTPRLSNIADGMPASLVKEPRPAERLRHVLKLSTGFGGVNCALVLRHG